MNEKEYYKKLGEEIRALRESKGIKQSELAKKMGIKPSILSEFENKGTRISAYRLNQIIQILTGESLLEKKTPKLKLQVSTPTPSLV